MLSRPSLGKFSPSLDKRLLGDGERLGTAGVEEVEDGNEDEDEDDDDSNDAEDEEEASEPVEVKEVVITLATSAVATAMASGRWVLVGMLGNTVVVVVVTAVPAATPAKTADLPVASFSSWGGGGSWGDRDGCGGGERRCFLVLGCNFNSLALQILDVDN